MLDSNKDAHKIIKATKEGGEISIETIDEFRTIESNFLTTNGLQNKRLFYLTSTGVEECKHTAEKRLTLARYVTGSRNPCPHSPNGINVYCRCESRKEYFQNTLKLRAEFETTAFYDIFIEPVKTYNLQMMFEGNANPVFGKMFSLRRMCEDGLN